MHDLPIGGLFSGGGFFPLRLAPGGRRLEAENMSAKSAWIDRAARPPVCAECQPLRIDNFPLWFWDTGNIIKGCFPKKCSKFNFKFSFAAVSIRNECVYLYRDRLYEEGLNHGRKEDAGTESG